MAGTRQRNHRPRASPQPRATFLREPRRTVDEVWSSDDPAAVGYPTGGKAACGGGEGGEGGLGVGGSGGGGDGEGGGGGAGEGGGRGASASVTRSTRPATSVNCVSRLGAARSE